VILRGLTIKTLQINESQRDIEREREREREKREERREKREKREGEEKRREEKRGHKLTGSTTTSCATAFTIYCVRSTNLIALPAFPNTSQPTQAPTLSPTSLSPTSLSPTPLPTAPTASPTSQPTANCSDCGSSLFLLLLFPFVRGIFFCFFDAMCNETICLNLSSSQLQWNSNCGCYHHSQWNLQCSITVHFPCDVCVQVTIPPDPGLKNGTVIVEVSKNIQNGTVC